MSERREELSTLRRGTPATSKIRDGDVRGNRNESVTIPRLEDSSKTDARAPGTVLASRSYGFCGELGHDSSNIGAFCFKDKMCS